MKDKIIELRDQGLTFQQITEQLGCSKSTVSYHIGKRSGRSAHTTCRNCGKDIISSKTFCDLKCNVEWNSKIRAKKLESGELMSNDTIRRALLEMHGESCSICGTSTTWNGKPLTLQVDHIDGNSDNNSSKNVRLVCPNCHSQLETSYGTQRVKKHTKRNKYLRKYKGYQDGPVV